MSKTYFTEDHEWLRVEGNVATVGITKYAQEQLGDLVFVDLPATGKARRPKAARRSLWNPSRQRRMSTRRLTAQITEVNSALTADPAIVNGSPESDGWLWKMTLANPSQLDGLMDEAAYLKMVG